MKVTITGQIDMSTLENAVYEKTGEIGSVDGVGADGDSAYNINEVSIKDVGDGKFLVTFDMERESGKFASKDEVAEQIVDLLDTTLEVEVAWEV